MWSYMQESEDFAMFTKKSSIENVIFCAVVFVMIYQLD